jgi:hypothetical protein
MDMPRFTAVASLYKTSGHYRADRGEMISSTRMNSTVYPTAIDEETIGEEVIVIHDSAPQEPWGLPWSWGSGGWGGPHGDSRPVSGPSNGPFNDGPIETTQPGPGLCRPPVGRVELKGVLMKQECRSSGNKRSCCAAEVSKCKEECQSDTNACTQWRKECQDANKICTGELPRPKAGELPLCF